jgi:hypothetical protein
MILNMKTKDPKGNFFAESKDLFVCLFVYLFCSYPKHI